MDGAGGKEFGVAFSFHSRDEATAQQLADRLSNCFPVFIYSEQQKMLAGRDGEEMFNAVYGRKARVVVVLCIGRNGAKPHAPKAPPQLAINNMKARPLNVNGSPALRQASNLLLPRLGPGVQKASSRAGSAYGVIFRSSATPFGSARNLAFTRVT
jgi:hypothetical protein